MSGERWALLARAIALVAGLGVATLSGLLIADGIAESGRVAAETARVEVLEERVLVEAEAAGQLAELQERHTARSVARDLRNRRLGYGLLLAAVVFLAAAKWRQSLAGEPPPALVTLAARTATEIRAPSPPPVPRRVVADTDVVDPEVVDALIEREGKTREASIPILQALQSHYRYLPESAIQHVCLRTEIAPAELVGVASFYAQFRRHPVGRYLVRVCHGTACHVAGIGPIMDELRRRLAIPVDGDTDPERRFTLESVNCLGCCSLAPVMMIEDYVAGRLTPASAFEKLETAEVES